MRLRVRLVVLLLAAVALAPLRPATAQPPVDASLPEAASLAHEVRARLEPDSVLLQQYTYRERRRDVKVSKLGKVHLGPWREFEVYPSREPGETYKRLVAVDGAPLPPDVLARRDAQHRQHVLDRQAQLAAETPAQRRKRQAKRERELREEREAIDDLFRIYRITVLRRERLDGRPTLVVSLVPTPNVQPRTDAGKYMARMQGEVWINEADRQVVRVEMEVTRDITFGFGLLARLHKGSEVVFRRALVNGEIWLPAEATFRTAGRALLFRRFDLETTTRFSEYRKFSVSTSEAVASSR